MQYLVYSIENKTKLEFFVKKKIIKNITHILPKQSLKIYFNYESFFEKLKSF